MNLDDTMFDIDNLAKKIEDRIMELEGKKEEVVDKEEIDKTIYDFGDLLNQIEAKIKEMEAYEEHKIDIDKVTEKVNNKLNYMLEFNDEEELDKTLYDLSEVSSMINETIAKLEKDKLKKEKKARYCELARQKNRQNKRNNNKSNIRKTKKQG